MSGKSALEIGCRTAAVRTETQRYPQADAPGCEYTTAARHQSLRLYKTPPHGPAAHQRATPPRRATRCKSISCTNEQRCSACPTRIRLPRRRLRTLCFAVTEAKLSRPVGLRVEVPQGSGPSTFMQARKGLEVASGRFRQSPRTRGLLLRSATSYSRFVNFGAGGWVLLSRAALAANPRHGRKRRFTLRTSSPHLQST